MTRNPPRLEPVPHSAVKLDDGFWGARIETNRTVTLPLEHEQLKSTGRLQSLLMRWRPGRPNPPHIFWDSDIAKWIEAVAYSLAHTPDPALERQADEVIERFARIQRPDGYLNTHFVVVEPEKRWTNLRDCHELYCAGHLMEAAVAYAEATGKRRLLDVMCRYADCIDSVFGRRHGKKRGYPGHEEIELALVKLHRATGKQRYLKLARYFVDERGRPPHYFTLEAEARGEADGPIVYDYNQSHLPVREQTDVRGHAVRAFYLYSGMADVAAQTGDAELLAACKRMFDDVVQHKLYITGGIGSTAHNEGFTHGYDLPNETAYAETCAAIALVFFAHRMLQATGEGRYADVMEQALYNGTLSGVSLDGSKFFYANPLAAHGDTHRSEWFGCACCPPNIARLIASIGGYVYSVSPNGLHVHLYAAGAVGMDVGGQPVRITQETAYPWDGGVRMGLTLDRPTTFTLALRLPGWCRGHALSVNGKAIRAPVSKGYLRVRRRWRDGDRLTLELAMPVERIAAHPRVLADAGRVALKRGPMVYCLEDCDHPSGVATIRLPDHTELTARLDTGLLGECVVLEGDAVATRDAGWRGRLYRRAEDVPTKRVKIRAVPYFLWDNRAPGAMAVWLPQV